VAGVHAEMPDEALYFPYIGGTDRPSLTRALLHREAANARHTPIAMNEVGAIVARRRSHVEARSPGEN
jgi:hypothetical protein